ncbi:MAG TPA: glycosyl hydrolase [Prolixibacteraceae bacterium]|nr:glycosyl hydrolase [Prolixibacteraceae bacterium]
MKTNKSNRTSFLILISVLIVLVFTFGNVSGQKSEVTPGWPKITKESKPWSRWWWMGNSVSPSDLKVAMEAYSKAGLGGLEITPIYGVHGYENRFIKFLSPEWIENFKYTLQEGKNLDLGIDLAMASGWPFGGLWVTPEDACKYMSVQSFTLNEGEFLQEKVVMIQEPLLRTVNKSKLDFSQIKYPVSENEDSLQNWAVDQIRYPMPMVLQTLMAYSDKGEILNVTDQVNTDGILLWKATAGKWILYAVFEGWHGKMVERAGPGGEGDVIDHFSAKAIDNYLGHFTTAFKGQDLSGLRAYFNDSYEVDDARGEANFTPLLFDEFQKRRGYDLREYLPALIGRDEPEYNQRVLCDYRETVSDLILENYTQRWHDWAANGGQIIRNQAHGAPANILDLYAAADIPETEGEDIVKVKTASSVAHVTGKKLASSESATWLKDHFEASLSDVKQAIDLFLLAGINHVFYHGTTFSPQDAKWPGWMFYAAVNFAPSNTFWNDFGTLNTYIARSQSFLQAGKPDNDVLLYYPISDEYAVRGKSLLLHFDGAAKGSSVRESAEYLFGKGFAFDYISDRQILNLESQSGQILTGGTSYQTILLPPVKLIPLETFEKVIELARGGATVLMEQLPEDVPGLGMLTERQTRFHDLKKTLKFDQTSEIVRRAKVGKGQILMGSLVDLLAASKIRRESMFDNGLQCIRRTDGNTTTYFIANRGTEMIDGMVSLQTKISSAVLYNPMTGAFGKVKTNTSGQTGAVYLQLVPGESCLVQVFSDQLDVPEFQYLKVSGENKVLKAEWTLTFLTGGPELPKPVKLSNLGSWTDIQGDSYKAFSGTAVYKTTFVKPSENAEFYRLDLGKVDHSAMISVNGKELATLVSLPFSVDIPASELKTTNTLEISVTNLMGNRIADMERKGQPYKIFYNVNFPAKEAANRGADGLFTTQSWKPQESGLLGPVSLTPLQLIK